MFSTEYSKICSLEPLLSDDLSDCLTTLGFVLIRSPDSRADCWQDDHHGRDGEVGQVVDKHELPRPQAQHLTLLWNVGGQKKKKKKR